MKVRVRIEKGGRMPERKTAGAAGFDCYARSVELDGDWWVYHLGFAIEIPEGYVGLIFPALQRLPHGAEPAKLCGSHRL